MNELACEIGKIVGKEIQVKHLPLPQDDPKQRQPNIERAKRLLGWQPTVQLREGLNRTVNYFAWRVTAERAPTLNGLQLAVAG